jgi:hypothetical protein
MFSHIFGEGLLSTFFCTENVEVHHTIKPEISISCFLFFLIENEWVLKFGLSEKHTKFEKIFLVVLTNQLIYLVNVKTIRKIFSNYVCFSKSL